MSTVRTLINLADIPTWSQTFEQLVAGAKISYTVKLFLPSPSINNKVSLFQGDITKLKLDAIVNAANETLLGGGGVDGAIHRVAGKDLHTECVTLDGCSPGEAKITKGYNLPAKNVIHTVGPRGENPEILGSCYEKCFVLLSKRNLKSIAFPCISTGIFGYPRRNAAHVALRETRTFLEKQGEEVERVIFCVFLEEDLQVYEELMQGYFPVEDSIV